MLILQTLRCNECCTKLRLLLGLFKIFAFPHISTTLLHWWNVFQICRWNPSHRKGSIQEFTNYVFIFQENVNDGARACFTISWTWFLLSHEFKIRNIQEFTNSQTNLSIFTPSRWKFLCWWIIDDIVFVNSRSISSILTNSRTKKIPKSACTNADLETS